MKSVHLCRYVGGGALRWQHLARAEPLTALPRSARSRVSWSRSGCLLRVPPPTSLWDSRTTRSGCAASRAIKEDRFCLPSLAPAASAPSGLGEPAAKAGDQLARRVTALARRALRACAVTDLCRRG